MDICSATSHPFGFPSRIRPPPLDTLEFLVTTLISQNKKFELFRVDEYGALEIYYELMKACQIMNIRVQATGGYTSSLNGKIEIPYNKLANITRYLIMKSSHNKELWCFAYQYDIYPPHKT